MASGKIRPFSNDTATSVPACDNRNDRPDSDDQTIEASVSNDTAVALAIFINLAMVTILAVAVFVPLRLHIPTTGHGQPSTTGKTLYVTMLTIVGTASRSFTSSQIRRQWLKSFDLKLNRGHSLLQVNSPWRTALGIGTVRELWGQWRIVASFVFSVLTVTAFVTGLSSNRAEETVPFSYFLPEDSTSYCMGVGASKIVNETPSMSWLLPNGSDFEVFPIMDFCPTAQTMLLMGTINTVDPQEYGYGDLGVAVRSRALGSQGSFYAPFYPTPNSQPQTGLNELIKKYGTDLVRVHGCSPVLSDNPFQCKKIDPEFVNSNLYISSDNSLCSVWKKADPKSDYVFKICAHGSIGEGTLLIAHIGTSAIYAAEAMDDGDQRRAWENIGFPRGENGQVMLYGVQCNIRVSIQARDLTLIIADDSHTSGSFTRTLGAGANCSIASNYGLDHLKATVVAGAFQPLEAGWITHIRLVAISPNATNAFVRSGPFAYQNSQSALEDVLGLTAALSLSRLSLTGRAPSVVEDGNAVILYNRVGPGKTWALVFVLPPLLNTIILASLWWTSQSRIPITTSAVTSDLSRLENFVRRLG